MPIRERIFKHSTPEPNSGCWLWLGGICEDGYGKMGAGRETLAHRLSYIEFIGPIPAHLEIDHKCRVRSCVNPAHLQLLPHAENVRRRLPYERANSKKTHCKYGHPFDDVNTFFELWRGIVMRKCRQCRNLRQRERYARMRGKR